MNILTKFFCIFFPEHEEGTKRPRQRTEHSIGRVRTHDHSDVYEPWNYLTEKLWEEIYQEKRSFEPTCHSFPPSRVELEQAREQINNQEEKGSPEENPDKEEQGEEDAIKEHAGPEENPSSEEASEGEVEDSDIDSDYFSDLDTEFSDDTAGFDSPGNF